MSPSLTRIHHACLAGAALLLLALTVWQGQSGASWINRPFNGFFVQPMLYVSPYQQGSWGLDRHGLEPVDVILKVEGSPVRDMAELVERARAVPVGTPLLYEVKRGGTVRAVTVPTRLFTAGDFLATFGFYVLMGWSFLLMAFTLLALRPALPAARAFALLAGSVGLVFAFFYDFQTTARFAPLFQAAYPLMGWGFLATALYFPRRSRLLERFPRLPHLLAALAPLLAVGYQGVLLDVGASQVEAGRYALALHAVFGCNFLIAGGLLALIAAIVFALATEPGRSPARKQANIAVFGAIAGLAPLLAWVAPSAFGINSPVPLAAALPFLLLFPASIVVAIVRARLFDITVAVRVSLLYAGLSLALTAVYLAAATGARLLLPVHSPGEGVLATLAVIALFVPLRDRLQALIDRRLFRAAYDAEQALEEASRTMTTLLERGRIVDQLRRVVTDTLQPEREAVVLADEAEAASLMALASAEGVWQPAPEGPHVPFAAFPWAELAVPLRFQGRLLGCLLLGPKRADTAYTTQDRKLLMILANQSAIALANAAAYERLQRFNQELEQRVAERTEALEAAQARLVQTEKMSALGQLVAGVAHELNNPVTVLVSGIDLMAERIEALKALSAALDGGATSEEMAELRAELDAEALGDELETIFAACQEGASRTQAIVEGLRQFSRLDGYAHEPIALSTCIETTIPMIEATFAPRVKLHVELAEVPPVRGSAIHLKQVVTNLLVNACQAVAEGGEVWLALRPAAQGVTLSVRDNGPGIPDAVRERIFEPFFTTKPVGLGTGLGLSICHGIVAAHHGRLEVESAPGAGCEFRVVLPAAAMEVHA